MLYDNDYYRQGSIPMEKKAIPHDDLLDVMELAQDIETYISNALEDKPHNLAISALLSATVNSFMRKSRTVDDAVFNRNFFIQVMDLAIQDIKSDASEEL